MLKYGAGQPSVLASNPAAPVYTLAYRPNNGGNMLTSNFLTGPAGTTYVTAARRPIAEINSLNSDSDHEIDSKRKHSKKVFLFYQKSLHLFKSILLDKYKRSMDMA